MFILLSEIKLILLCLSLYNRQAYFTRRKLLFFILKANQTHFLMKITAIYSKNCSLHSKNYKIIPIFTYYCSNFHENLSLFHRHYIK